MRVEIQEGVVRMQRLPRCNDYKATVATTLRLAGGVRMGELQIDEEKRPQRVLFGDSWFASLSTCLALQKEFGIHFTGIAPPPFFCCYCPHSHSSTPPQI